MHDGIPREYALQKYDSVLKFSLLRKFKLPASASKSTALRNTHGSTMSANEAGCFCKGDTLMSVTVGVVSFGFLAMFGLLIPTGILTIGALR